MNRLTTPDSEADVKKEGKKEWVSRGGLYTEKGKKIPTPGLTKTIRKRNREGGRKKKTGDPEKGSSVCRGDTVVRVCIAAFGQRRGEKKEKRGKKRGPR